MKIVFSVLLFLFFSFLSVSSEAKQFSKCDEGLVDQNGVLKKTPTSLNGSPRFVALVLHGLNLKPSKMDSLGSVLSAMGGDVYRIALSGHPPAEGKFEDATSQSWMSEVTGAYCLAKRRADAVGRAGKRVPLLLVGFSLGGVLGERLLQAFSTLSEDGKVLESAFDKQILFAPALVLRARSYLVKALWFFGRSFRITSGNAPDYRANEGTPMGAYRALFGLIEDFEISSEQNAAVLNIPSLIFFDLKDELLASEGLSDWSIKKGLTNWRFVTVSNAESTLEKKMHHLIIDDVTLGASEWRRVEAELKSWLAKN